MEGRNEVGMLGRRGEVRVVVGFGSKGEMPDLVGFIP